MFDSNAGHSVIVTVPRAIAHWHILIKVETSESMIFFLQPQQGELILPFPKVYFTYITELFKVYLKEILFFIF